jgi:hypothetical protein
MRVRELNDLGGDAGEVISADRQICDRSSRILDERLKPKLRHWDGFHSSPFMRAVHMGRQICSVGLRGKSVVFGITASEDKDSR